MNQLDPASLAKCASGLLYEFHVRQLLDFGDVHAATKLAWMYGESDEQVILATAFVVHALQSGSACLDLNQIPEQILALSDEAIVVPDSLWPEANQLIAALIKSPLVSVGALHTEPKALRLIDNLLYLERYWALERSVKEILFHLQDQSLCDYDPDLLRELLDELFESSADEGQRAAAATSVLSRFTVIAGGPGTGKTYTIAKIIALHLALNKAGLRVALAAPTGKAAARVKESLHAASASLPTTKREQVDAINASTLHRLLGWSPEGSNRFVHNQYNRLPFDLIVVDEASMVSLTMMSRLLNALPSTARLIMVGDPDQLTPVDAGAVLADICELPLGSEHLAKARKQLKLPHVLNGTLAQLTVNHRFGGTMIDQAATALRAFDSGAVLDLIHHGDDFVLWNPLEPKANSRLRALILSSVVPMITAAKQGDAETAVRLLQKHQLLCAHRNGPAGVSFWNAQVRSWLASEISTFDPHAQWFPGQPILYTRNSEDLGLYNGDTGIVILQEGQLVAYFSGTGSRKPISVHLLTHCETSFAMTVHKAQGSQFKEVTLVLPPIESPLLTHELLYTAVTRAEKKVLLFGSEESLIKAATTRAVRASGLAIQQQSFGKTPI